MSRKKGQKDVIWESARIAKPLTRWLKARKRSAAKLRSANWLLKNMPTTAAIGKAFRIHACSQSANPKLGRYPKINGNQAPQMKNSKTIIKKSRKRLLLIGGSTVAQQGE